MAFEDLENEVERRRAASQRLAVAPLTENEGETPAPLSCEELVETRDCDGCGRQFQARSMRIGGEVAFVMHHCRECCDAYERSRETEADQELKLERATAWMDLCPPDYQDTDLDKIRAEWKAQKVAVNLRPVGGTEFRRASMEDILAIRPDEGLALIGATGLGKTRLMFELCRRYHMRGIKVVYVNGASFADKLTAAFSEGGKHAESFMQRHITARVLFYDDLGKEAAKDVGGRRMMSERSEEALYRLLEERKAARRVIHYTSNKALQQIGERLSEDRGGPILRRLRSMCVTVALQSA